MGQGNSAMLLCLSWVKTFSCAVFVQHGKLVAAAYSFGLLGYNFKFCVQFPTISVQMCALMRIIETKLVSFAQDYIFFHLQDALVLFCPLPLFLVLSLWGVMWLKHIKKFFFKPNCNLCSNWRLCSNLPPSLWSENLKVWTSTPGNIYQRNEFHLFS